MFNRVASELSKGDHGVIFCIQLFFFISIEMVLVDCCSGSFYRFIIAKIAKDFDKNSCARCRLLSVVTIY